MQKAADEKIREDDSMGMMIGGMYSNKRVIQLKKPDGTVAATVSFSRAKQKKTKRLNYNFKSVSSQILLAKTANSAGKVVTRARGTVAMLLRKVGSGDYDDTDLRHAILHARKMERIAKKREKHLKQEEDIEQKGKTQEQEDMLTEELQNQEEQEEELELSEEELKRLFEEYQDLMRESMEDMLREAAMETECEELCEEFTGAVYEMEPEDLEKLKKKHRTDEMREIMDADLKYLRAVFQKLEKERQALNSGAKNFSDMSGGVSLEIAGLDLPVDMPEVPEIIQGSNIDAMA